MGSYEDLNSTSHYLGSEFFDAYFNESYTRIGDMLFDGKKDARWLHDKKGEGTIRWAMYEQILMGSPAVELKLPPKTSIKMKIIGPHGGDPGVEYNFSLEVTGLQEVEGEHLYYIWSWGDGSYSDWLGPFKRGEKVYAKHSWGKEGTYNIRIRLMDEYGYKSYWSNPYVFVVDSGSPNVEIASPTPGIYIGNNKISWFFIPLIIGRIDIIAVANDDSGIDFVEFYIDDELRAVIDSPPYKWVWDEFIFGMHKIKVKAYDLAGKTATDEIKVFIFNI